MADVTTVIARSSHVRGRVSGAGNLEIQGRVDGEVEVTGELVVDTDALVASNLTARRLIIRGAVKGDLTATEGVVLEDGARVVGDVRAPRISIAPGALLRGYVQTAGNAEAPASRAKASATQHVSRPQPKAIAAPVPAPRAVPPRAVVAVPARKPTPAVAAKAGPPSPVVPALRKGAKGSLHKKRAG